MLPCYPNEIRIDKHKVHCWTCGRMDKTHDHLIAGLSLTGSTQ